MQNSHHGHQLLGMRLFFYNARLYINPFLLGCLMTQPVPRSKSVSTNYFPTFSGGPHAQVPGPRRDRRDGLRAVGPCQQLGSAATERGLLCHPQPAHHCKNGRHQQSMRKPVQPGSGDISRDFWYVTTLSRRLFSIAPVFLGTDWIHKKVRLLELFLCVWAGRHASNNYVIALLLVSLSRWAIGLPAQRAGSQVLLRDEEPGLWVWRAGCSRRGVDHRHCGERRPPCTHH